MRGAAGTFPLDEKTVAVVGASLTRHLREKIAGNVRLIIGRDTRESGEILSKAFIKGAHSAGAECVTAEVITTPGVAFLTRRLDFTAGIVISASHNPFTDNGVKVFLPSGLKLDEATEKLLEADIYADCENGSLTERIENFQFAAESPTKHSVDELHELYLNFLREEFQNLNLKGLKIVTDTANGAATDFAPALLASFNAEIVALNNKPNGRNINENCGSLHIEGLQKRVLEEKADFGVAFDGDADRALFVDEKGRFIDGDATLFVMANHLAKHKNLKGDTVVATVMSNIGLEIILEKNGIKLTRTAVGDKYVLEELLKNGASIGGEQSGHIIFPQRSLVGDGMFTMLSVLAAMRENNASLSTLTTEFISYPQILVNVKVREKIPFHEVAEIAAAVRQLESELDGSGRLLLRYSGTENLARVMIEGKNQAEIEAQAHSMANVISGAIGA